MRKKLNKSGSYSIQVLKKEGRKNVLVRTIGSSSDLDDIQRLTREGNNLIRELRGQLDLQLFKREEEKWFDQVFSQVEGISLLGPELILGKIFDEIGFNQIAEEIFRDLVLSRIVYPTSKLKTVRYLQEARNISYPIKKIYKYMDKIHNSLKESIQLISYEHTKQILKSDPSVIFYDVTTIYFEAEKEDELRMVGFSKEGKHKHPQILLGLLVSIDGYPLAYEIFEGNKYEGHTMLPVVDAFKERFSLSELIIVADSGLLTNKNIEELIEKQYKFILGARIKSESTAIKERILSLELENGKTSIINKSDKIRLIISYSEKRAKKDQYNRQRGLDKLKKAVASGKLSKNNINNRGYNKYLKLEGNVSITIDESKFEADGKWDGLKGYITNTEMSADDLINNYNELWKIEKAFRISKTDLRIRPIYHRIPRRIEAHICISFAAYKVYKELERKLKVAKSEITIERAIELSKTIYGLTIKHPISKSLKTKVITTNLLQNNLLSLIGVGLGDPNA